jgi:hypothetical protein
VSEAISGVRIRAQAQGWCGSELGGEDLD